MPVLVRNTEAGPTVFTDTNTNTQVEWQGADDPSGEDVQQVPDALIENVAFLRAVNRGILVVEEASDATREALARQTESWQARRKRAEDASTDAMDEQANNDLIQMPCIGPSQRGSGECGEPVPVREKQKHDKPVLCSRHAALTPQYVFHETDQMVDGVPVKKWTRSMVTGRERQQAT